MLTRLSIANLATIESLALEFDAGFTVFTGETGAGKSILIDAIRLVLGAKGSPELLRTGATQTVVEAAFDLARLPQVQARLQELGVPAQEELVLRRVLQDNGRSRALANDCLLSLAGLESLAAHLVSIHGQHDNQALLQPASHIDFLDIFGDLLPQREEVGRLHQQHTRIARDLRELDEQAESREQRRQALAEVVEDLHAAALRPGEDEALRQELALLTHAEKLIQATDAVGEALNEGESAVLARLGLVGQWLEQAARLDPSLAALAEQVPPLRFQLDDLHRAVERYRARLEPDPERLERLNERLALIEKLKRRHGGTLAAALARLAEAERELEALENPATTREALAAERERVAGSLHRSAQALSACRKQVAAALDREVLGHLRELGMEKAAFETRIAPARAAGGKSPAYSPLGGDEVEFRLSPNPGQALRSLARIASGGELSRIMLALKSVLAKADPTGTLIFDEVDQGVSGGMAEIVGRKLRALGASHQVLCVTHLPQIAALGEHHVLVTKEMEPRQTFTRALRLEGEDKVREVARLLSGIRVSDHSLRSAEEMVQRGR